MTGLQSFEYRPSYPVAFDVDRQLDGRNRISVLFRLILAIPHIIIVGAPAAAGIGAFGTVFAILQLTGQLPRYAIFPGGNLLSIAVGVVVIISWFSILFSGKQSRAMWDFACLYLRWRAKSYSYMALLRDEYPPFGDGDYPVTLTAEFPSDRHRWSVALRWIYAIPHSIVLFFLGIAAFLSTVMAWVAILGTGKYPRGLYVFNVGVLRWSMRYSAYTLLIVDEYPPFRLDP